MAARLVWIIATGSPLQLDCGHTSRGNGTPTPATHQPPQVGDEYYCEVCDLGVVAQLDQELARAREQRAE